MMGGEDDEGDYHGLLRNRPRANLRERICSQAVSHDRPGSLTIADPRNVPIVEAGDVFKAIYAVTLFILLVAVLIGNGQTTGGLLIRSYFRSVPCRPPCITHTANVGILHRNVRVVDDEVLGRVEPLICSLYLSVIASRESACHTLNGAHCADWDTFKGSSIRGTLKHKRDARDLADTIIHRGLENIDLRCRAAHITTVSAYGTRMGLARTCARRQTLTRKVRLHVTC